MSAARIQMLDYEKPGLEADNYQIKIEQSIQGSLQGIGFSDTLVDSDKTIDLAVAGDRFTLSTTYSPIRSGSLKLSGVRLVDTFGQDPVAQYRKSRHQL